MIQQKEEKLTENKEHSKQIKDKKSRRRENKVRPLDTRPESQVKIEDNGTENISPTKQGNESTADSSEHFTSTTKTTKRKNKNSPLSAGPQDIREMPTYSEGEKEGTNNAKENGLNKQQNGKKVESHVNLESTGENGIKSNEKSDKENISPDQQRDESFVDSLKYSASTDEKNMIGANENKNDSLSSDPLDSNEMSTDSKGKADIHEDTKNNSLLEQQNGNNSDDLEYLDSTEENVTSGI